MEYTMKERRIPFDAGWDVIVAGGGPAGVTAAVAAARDGARTLLIEATGALGGMSTMGLVPAWCPFSDKNEIIYRGLASYIFNEGKRRMPYIDQNRADWVPINPEIMKVIYDELAEKYGVTVLFGTQLCSVEMSSPGNVGEIIVSNKAGLTAYRACVYIDATGDADLAAWAGAEFQMGDDDGSLQPATHCFSLGGVNYERYTTGVNLHGSNKNSPVHAMAGSDRYPLITDTHFCNNTIFPGAVGFNAGHIDNVNGCDPFSLSRALAEGRRKAAQIRDGLAEFYPEAFGSSYMAQTAPLMGIRETRRIIGDYTLTLDDYMNRADFFDEISRNSYYIDVHGKSGVEARYGKGESHGIPYRCLTPRGIRNLLVAGRSVSCDRMIHGSVRVMPNCLTTGEAAGAAAALAIKTAGCDVHAVDTAMLRDILRGYGAYFK